MKLKCLKKSFFDAVNKQLKNKKLLWKQWNKDLKYYNHNKLLIKCVSNGYLYSWKFNKVNFRLDSIKKTILALKKVLLFGD